VCGAVVLGFGAGVDVGGCVGGFVVVRMPLGVGRVGAGVVAGPAGGTAEPVSGEVCEALTAFGGPVGVGGPAFEPDEPPLIWSWAGGWSTGLLQATQARTTATAAAAVLA